MQPPPYIVLPAKPPVLPVIVSVPHCGTELPADIRGRLRPELATGLVDTDWFVDELYDFAPACGITLVKARYSRMVVDLNRDPAGARLYQDGRPETGLVPVTDFSGARIYLPGQAPDEQETERRRAVFYEPYHAWIREGLADLRQKHGFRNVLLWDAHSIRRMVPAIRSVPFPDMILGDRDGTSAAGALTEAALTGLRRPGGAKVAHNDPFKGGWITRSFGRPATGIHALQLEMSQDVYMNESAVIRDPLKEAPVKDLLRSTLLTLGRLVAEMP